MDKRTWKIRCAAFCSSLAACALLPAAFALLEKEDPAPAVTTFSKVEDAGKTVTFSQEDFTTRLTGEDTLEGIVVSALPDRNGPICDTGFSRTAFSGPCAII